MVSKNQFINWNIECAILLIYVFQQYYSNKIEIVIVIVVPINQSFLIIIIEFIHIYFINKNFMKMKGILDRIEWLLGF